MTYVRCFSPGPWKVFSDGYDTWIENNNHAICSLYSMNDQPVEANVRLIAHAPTMVELLRNAYVQLQRFGDDGEAQKMCAEISKVVDAIYGWDTEKKHE